MSKRCKLQKEYYQQYGKYKGNGKYCDKYVSWLEEQILALRTHDAVGRSEQLKAVEKLKDFAYEVCPLHREDDLGEIVGSL